MRTRRRHYWVEFPDRSASVGWYNAFALGQAAVASGSTLAEVEFGVIGHGEPTEVECADFEAGFRAGPVVIEEASGARPRSQSRTKGGPNGHHIHG